MNFTPRIIKLFIMHLSEGIQLLPRPYWFEASKAALAAGRGELYSVEWPSSRPYELLTEVTSDANFPCSTKFVYRCTLGYSSLYAERPNQAADTEIRDVGDVWGAMITSVCVLLDLPIS